MPPPARPPAAPRHATGATRLAAACQATRLAAACQATILAAARQATSAACLAAAGLAAAAVLPSASANDLAAGSVARPPLLRPGVVRTGADGLTPPVAIGAQATSASALPDSSVPATRVPAGDAPLEDAGPAPRSGLLAALAVVGSALVGGLTLGGGSAGGVLLAVIAASAALWLLRRFLLGSPLPSPMIRTEPAGWGPLPPPQADPVPPLASAAPDGGALRLPPGFDLSAFLREARLSFVRLQAANDRADLADLREFTTPQMFAALALQIEQRNAQLQQVEVMALDAQLLDLAVDREDAVATVRFHGSARADLGTPEAFTEVWHVRKSLSDPRSAWLLDGIQQST